MKEDMVIMTFFCYKTDKTFVEIAHLFCLWIYSTIIKQEAKLSLG